MQQYIYYCQFAVLSQEVKTYRTILKFFCVCVSAVCLFSALPEGMKKLYNTDGISRGHKGKRHYNEIVLKGQFTAKSKIHIFPLSAIYQSR